MNFIKYLLISILQLGCAYQDDKQLEKIPPKNLPDSVFWAGGIDDGNWYYVKFINDHRNMARIAVYDGHDGGLIIDTTFMLMCDVEKYAFINDLKKQISGFDGSKIYFIKSDGQDCYLQAVELSNIIY